MQATNRWVVAGMVLLNACQTAERVYPSEAGPDASSGSLGGHRTGDAALPTSDVAIRDVSNDSTTVPYASDGSNSAGGSHAGGSSAGNIAGGSNGAGSNGGNDSGAVGAGGAPPDAGGSNWRYDAGTDDASNPDATILPVLSCAEAQVRGTGQPLAKTSTVDRADNFRGSCGSGSSSDIAFDWIVPATDYYSVNTIGSDFDTVLFLREAACDGSEIACNDNTSSSPQSEILAHFIKDQRIVIVVDGSAGERGSVAVNAERITCPAIDLTGQPLPVSRSTSGGTNTHSGACGGEGQVERAYRWTPPQSGLYSITASSTEFRPILYVENGPRCGGRLLGCNKASTIGIEAYPAEVVRYLVAGEPVTLIVDGGTGFFSLDARRIDLGDAGVSCSNLPTTFGTSIAGPGDGVSHSTASCSAAGGLDAVGDGPFPWPDDAYAFTVDYTAADMSCTYTVTASGPINVYLLGQGCSGPEKKCVTSTPVSGSYRAQFTVTKADNGVYTMVVENASGLPITYDVGMACVL